MAKPIEYRENIRPILAAIKSVEVPLRPAPHAAPAVLPFITISREPGAGGWMLAQQLVEALNAEAGDGPWTSWDRELVEKVAADEHVSTRLVESLGQEYHSWIADFWEAFSLADSAAIADEAKLYSRMAATIRALARAGNVVVVGMGSVFITRHMPGGIHIRLVAPLEHRIQFMEQQYHLTHDEAEQRIKRLEHARQAFLNRYWPKEMVTTPETYTLTLNTGMIPQEKMVQMIKVLVK